MIPDFDLLYKDFKNPGSFSGFSKFYKFVKQKHPSVKRKDVQNYLMSSDPYTLHKQKKKVKKFRRIMLRGVDYQYSMDLVDLQKYSRINNGYRYILNIIDAFSKRVWSFPLKRKTGKEMATLLDKFFKLNRPQKVEVDLGRYHVSLSIPNELKLCIHSCFRERILE